VPRASQRPTSTAIPASRRPPSTPTTRSRSQLAAPSEKQRPCETGNPGARRSAAIDAALHATIRRQGERPLLPVRRGRVSRSPRALPGRRQRRRPLRGATTRAAPLSLARIAIPYWAEVP
jgi:hypothetical protein